ncbi:MAG TPA: VCBS repeat-containing protein, partial [Thermoplasmata archaeon]|nr:VCBS repeat-containing protein [Thermoplasmata archaeon]
FFVFSADGVAGESAFEKDETVAWDDTLKHGDLKFFDDAFWLGGTADHNGVGIWKYEGYGWNLSFSNAGSGSEYDACAFDTYKTENDREEFYFLAVGSVTNRGVDIFFYKNGTWQFAGGDYSDYDPEKISGSYSNPIRVLSIDTGDINNDGNTDLVAGYLNGGIRIWFGDGEGHWENKTSLWKETPNIDEDGDYYSVNLVDFNGDNKLDIVSSHKDNQEDTYLDVFLGDGTGGWTYEHRFERQKTAYSTILFEDLDKDNDLDIIAVDPNEEGIDVIIKKGDMLVDGENVPTKKDSYSSLASGDINFDGYVDIIASYKPTPSSPDGIVIYYGKEGENEQDWRDAQLLTSVEKYTEVFFSPAYNEMINGLPQEGEAYNLYIVALNAKNKSKCIESWKTALPKVVAASFSEKVIFPLVDFYILNITVSSSSFSEGYQNISSLMVTLEGDIESFASFIWYEDGEDSYINILEGKDFIYVDRQNITISSFREDEVSLSFPLCFSFHVPKVYGGKIKVNVTDDRGFESGMTIPSNPDNLFAIFPNFYIGDFRFSDTTLNPNSSVNVTGYFYLKNEFSDENISFPYSKITKIALVEEKSGLTVRSVDLKNHSEMAELFEEEGRFNFSYEIGEETKSGTYFYYITLSLNPRVKSVQLPESFAANFSFKDEKASILVNYLVVEDLICKGFVDYHVDERIYWQRSGEPLIVRAIVRWSKSMSYLDGEWVEGEEIDYYQGEIVIHTPEGEMVTDNLQLSLVNETEGITVIEVEVQPNSALAGENNPFGKRLIIQEKYSLKLGWDGEPPTLYELDVDSIKNGSKVKRHNEKLIVYVHERNGFENEINEDIGKIILHWSGNISGSTEMTIVNKTNYWRCEATIPFS